MRRKLILMTAIALLAVPGFAQTRAAASIAERLTIIKAEDARDYSPALEAMIDGKHSEDTTVAAALAAGRIGDPKAIVPLVKLMKSGSDAERGMAIFALGEIEAIEAADDLVAVLNDKSATPAMRARAVEAVGKIAAANAKDPRTKELGTAILDVLRSQTNSKNNDELTTLLALTAALRVRPEGADAVVAKFLDSPNARIAADAENTFARIKGKNANEKLRSNLTSHKDAVVRANAARALGAADDKDSVDLLLKAATSDDDLRVRVSAVRSLAALKATAAADALLSRGELLLAAYPKAKKPDHIPAEQNEFVEIAAALGRILANTNNERADKLFAAFGKLDKGYATEVYVARVRVGPKRGDGSKPELESWRQLSTLAQIVGEFADIEPTSDVGKTMKAEASGVLRPLAKAIAAADPAAELQRMYAAPDILQSYAKFKTEDLGEIARTALQNKDVQTRVAAAGIIGDLATSKENVDALKSAFTSSLVTDKLEDDAQLAILDAFYKLDKKESAGSLLVALNAPDYLVRKKAFDLLADKDLQKELPGIVTSLENAKAKRKGKVLPYTPAFGTKLGQVLNTDADYRRALARKNGSVKAVLSTQKGTFTIDLLPEDAPLTVDNFVKLARAEYFDGLEVHRVVPNFVMQDGDPRGDGNGGPGWSIRCEINMVPYDRGAVGMALSGKDTGGSQWFVTHSPQPHLDGGYTVFGRVNEADMKVVDSIVRGDKILSVKIVGK